MSVDFDVQIDEKIKATTKLPSKFNVVMLNDDTTPMDWVIDVLKTIFKHSYEAAEKITMTIHTEGSAVVGTYSYEIAEAKSNEAINASRSNGFPLVLRLEEV